MLFQIAWKNIWRNKTRSLLVMGSVVMGLWVGAFMMAYAFGMIDQRLQDAVKNEISHFQSHHPKFEIDNEVKYFLSEGPEMLRKIRLDKRVKAATGRVIVNGMVSSANYSTGGRFIGIIPAFENEVTGLQDKLTEGAYFDENSRNKVIIGERLAEKLKVKLRSKIVLTFQDSTGNILAGAFRIRGLYKTYNATYDETNIFVRAMDIDQLINLPGQYHEIAALIHDPGKLDTVITDLTVAYPKAKTEDWKDIAPEISLMIESFDQYMIIFLIIILLALSFGIINTMLMAVLERVREIGVLMAIGMNRTKLFFMISLETICLVMAATPFGMLLGYFTVQYLGKTGMDLSAIYQEGYAAYGVQSYIYPKLEDIYYIRVMCMVIVTALLASIYPAITAIRLNPIKAIRKI
ncbi:FtsX-like permease family protein [Fulvivirgaceae bacterium BMA12]|uniref:FtsX-like permease family protein n=1 Tax=Agaribacillus aureus TaxID=3051825 RepID=A0ABT8L853_9BACT|nr:FtsX-like permease family protein [Fulvivirgaceae bacterium BMA12]